MGVKDAPCTPLFLDDARPQGTRRGRRFLEVTRFDRRGLCGRLPVVTLNPVAAEFVATITQWTAVASALRAQRRLPESDVRTLTPAYDMLPLAFAPTTQGEVVTRKPPTAVPDASVLSVWKEMKALAEHH